VSSRSDDEDNDDTAVHQRIGSTTTTTRRRTSIPIFRQKNNNDSGDDSDSVVSLHRDPLHRRRNLLTWRDPSWQPTSVNRLSNADRNNNNGKYYAILQCVPGKN